MAIGTIQNIIDDTAIIAAPHPGLQKLVDQGITECEVRFIDGRELSAKQRNVIFALVGDIAEYTSGYSNTRTTNEMLTQMQLNYVIDLCDKEHIRRALTNNYCRLMGLDLFSLAARTKSTADMSTARGFIDYLVGLCVEFGIPCSDTLLNRAEDIQRYLYACLWHRSCAICGVANGKADVHHVDTVGMGNDRRKINHIGLKAQPLCRLHHGEVGKTGQRAFDAKYHLQSIALDERLCKHLGLNTKGVAS